MIRVGIIGCGWAGSQHATSLQEMDDIRIEAIADVDSVSARNFSKRFGVDKTYTDYRALVDDEKVDAVFVTTPSKFHAEQAIHTLQKGKPVFSEKPPAISRGEMEKISREIEQRKGVYQIGFNRRFWPVYKKVKEIIASGRCSPYSIDIKMVDGHMKSPSWLLDNEMVGSYLHDSLIHMFDLVRFLFGEVSTVTAISRKNLYPMEDDWAVLLEFSNGLISTVTYTAHASFLNPTERLDIYGDHATILTEERWKLVFSRGVEDCPTIEVYDYLKMPPHVALGFKEEDEKFLESVREKKDTVVGIDSAYKAMQILFACHDSTRRNGTKISIL